MIPYWRVKIQPPPGVVFRDLPRTFVGKNYNEVSRALKKANWFTFSSDEIIGPEQQRVEHDFSRAITSINIDHEENKATVCKLLMPDPYMVLGDLFEPGMIVTVEGGWNIKGEYGEMFTGVIHKAVPKIRSGRKSVVLLTCLSDIYIMGTEDLDTPGMAEHVEEGHGDEDIEETDSEGGTYVTIIKAAAKRHGFKCGSDNVKLTPPIPANKPKSATNTPKKSDLSRLGEMAKKCYAAFWTESGTLWFASYTYIYDNFDPEYTFYFREIGRPVPSGLRFKEGIEGNAEEKIAIVDDIEITKGRPRKKLKTGGDLEQAMPTMIQADDVERKNPPASVVGYEVDDVKLEKLRIENPDEYDRLMDYVSPGRTHTVEWEKIKEWFIEIRAEHMSQADEREPGKKALKPDPRAFTDGLSLQLLMGSWAVRPVALCNIKGLGDRFDGKYYISKVSQSLKKGEYNTSITALRLGGSAGIREEYLGNQPEGRSHGFRSEQYPEFEG